MPVLPDESCERVTLAEELLADLRAGKALCGTAIGMQPVSHDHALVAPLMQSASLIADRDDEPWLRLILRVHQYVGNLTR